MKHTDTVTATNGYQSQAGANTNGTNGTRDDEGGGNLFALICGALCKDTPLAEAFGPNDNINNNSNSTPLMSPVQNGEQIEGSTKSGWFENVSDALIFHGFTLFLCCFLSLILIHSLRFINETNLSPSRMSSAVTETQGFSKDICRSMVAMLDIDHSGKLGLEEFKTLLNDIAKWKVI